MPMYLNAAIMLAATLGGFVLLARLAQSLRSRGTRGRLALRWPGTVPNLAGPSLLAVEQALAVDGKRRLLLVRCGARRVLLLTGGPADLVVSVLPDAAPDSGGAA